VKLQGLTRMGVCELKSTIHKCGNLIITIARHAASISGVSENV